MIEGVATSSFSMVDETTKGEAYLKLGKELCGTCCGQSADTSSLDIPDAVIPNVIRILPAGLFITQQRLPERVRQALQLAGWRVKNNLYDLAICCHEGHLLLS
jgi:hypothetical protein